MAANVPLLVIVSADSWCGFSKKIRKNLEEIKRLLPDVEVLYISDDDDPEEFKKVVFQHGITGFPHSLILVGDEKVRRIAGFGGVEDYRRRVREALVSPVRSAGGGTGEEWIKQIADILQRAAEESGDPSYGRSFDPTRKATQYVETIAPKLLTRILKNRHTSDESKRRELDAAWMHLASMESPPDKSLDGQPCNSACRWYSSDPVTGTEEEGCFCLLETPTAPWWGEAVGYGKCDPKSTACAEGKADDQGPVG